MANSWEFTYNGLTFGGAQNVDLTKIEGLSPPDVRDDSESLAQGHGGFVFAQYADMRTITFEGTIIGTSATDFETRVNAVRAAFSPRGSDAPLGINIPGDVAKYVNCRPLRLAFPIDPRYGIFYAEWSAQLKAADPRIYALSAKTLDIYSGASAGVGMVFPAVFSVNFGGGVSGQGTGTNAGTFSSPPTITITGPVTNPKITNLTTGEFTLLNGSIPAGESWVIDYAEKTIKSSGLTRYSTLDRTSTWWTMQPGDNAITLTGQDTTSATKISVAWSDAWL